MNQSPAEPIAIVGMQCLFPGAGNLEAYWANIVRGVDAIRGVPAARWKQGEYDLIHTHRGGFLDGLTAFDPLEYGIMPAAVQGGDPEQFLVFGVIHGALRDAARGRRFRETGVASPATPDPGTLSPRTEVVIGRGGYSGNTVETAYLRMEFVAQVGDLLARMVPGSSHEITNEIRKLLATGFPSQGTTEMLASSIPNLTAGRVSNRLDFQGANYTVDGACASGPIATDLVMRSLRDGRCDVGIAAAVHLVQKPHFWFAFELLQALSASGACRAYSRSADGLVIGEGMGALVLKRLPDALRDGDRIYAVLRSVGTSSDGRGMGIMTPRREGQVLALQRAYQDSGIDPGSIGLLEGHGTAMPVGDSTEIASLHEVFGKQGHPAVALGSVKSMIGHLMPAAGMAGLIKTVLAVYHRVLPPTLHVQEPNPELKESRFYVNTRIRPWITPVEQVRRAGVNAFGFGGINTHTILEDVAGETPRESYTPWSRELFLLTAPTREALVARIGHWHASLSGMDGHELRDVAYTASRQVSPTEPVRLAVVSASVADLRVKLEQARTRVVKDQAPSWIEDGGLSFAANAEPPGKVAFLFPGLAFPGLAAGYTERLGELCLHFPEARWYLDFAESLSLKGDAFSYPLSHQFFPPPLSDAKTLARLERELIWSKRTALGQMQVALATWNLLVSMGVHADVLAGFSLGEWAALVASGVLDHQGLRDMAAIWESLGDVPEQLTGLWGMVGANADKVQAVLDRVPGTAVIIMDPSPTQTFFAGEADTVRAALDLLRRDGVFVQEIPFPAIHTPLAGPIVEGLRAVKQSMPIHSPKARVYCGMKGRPYPDDPDLVRDWLIDSFREPLRGKDTILQLYHTDGVRTFIELGIGGRLPQSLHNVLGELPHFGLSVDARGDSGLEQFLELLGRLAVLGVPFDVEALYRRRPCRELDLSGQRTAASRTVMHLDLAQPRARVPDESVARLRQLIAPASTPPTNAPAEPAQAGGPVAEMMATMTRFLQVQQAHEQSETQLLTSYLAAQQTAMSRFLAGTPSPAPAPVHTTNGHRVTPTPTRLPFVGEVVRLVAGKELESRLVLDVGEHPFLPDHAFIKVPEEIKPAEERLPTLPMTFGLELIAEAAAVLVPDMQVVACHDVEASRWIALISQRSLPVTIRARRLDPTEVEVELQPQGQDRPALRGRVTLGHTLPVPPAPREVRVERPCAHRAEELYSIPLLYHGPRLQVVSKLVGTSDSTLVAELTLRDPQELVARPLTGVPLFDPVLVDGIGQAVGYKLLLDDWVTYPLRMGRMTRFAPTPPPGSVVRLLARYRKLDGRRVEIEADVLDPSGRLWLRLDHWHVWRILWPRELSVFSRQPRKHSVGVKWPTRNPRAHGCRMMTKLFGEINPEWIARYCLPPREWEAYRKEPRFDWLLGRIAVKDAVRDWFRQHRDEVLLHLEVEIAEGEDGRPVVLTPAGSNLVASVASVQDEALAVVAEARGVGVDLAVLTSKEPGQVARQRKECAQRALARALGQQVRATWRIVGMTSEGEVEIDTGEDTWQVETVVEGDRVLAVVTIE